MARLNVRPSYASTATSSRFPSATPGPADGSDQENHDPRAQMKDKGKQRAGDPPRRSSLPTPASDDDGSEARGQKRKRGSHDATQNHDSDDEVEDEFTKVYDPNQNPDERRKVMRKSRALEREFQGLFGRLVLQSMHKLISYRATR